MQHNYSNLFYFCVSIIREGAWEPDWEYSAACDWVYWGASNKDHNNHAGKYPHVFFFSLWFWQPSRESRGPGPSTTSQPGREQGARSLLHDITTRGRKQGARSLIHDITTREREQGARSLLTTSQPGRESRGPGPSSMTSQPGRESRGPGPSTTSQPAEERRGPGSSTTSQPERKQGAMSFHKIKTYTYTSQGARSLCDITVRHHSQSESRARSFHNVTSKQKIGCLLRPDRHVIKAFYWSTQPSQSVSCMHGGACRVNELELYSVWECWCRSDMAGLKTLAIGGVRGGPIALAV